MPTLERPHLKKELQRIGFFTLAFGAMIGVGWVTALGSWLNQAGPLGAALAFLVGGGVMVCISLCYAELTAMMPVAGGEVAYAYRAFGVFKSFVVGWCLAFGYIAISGFEAISIGLVLSFLMPQIDRWPLYTFAGSTVYLSHLILAVVFTGAITLIHAMGVKQAARLQNFLTMSFVLVCAIFIVAAFWVGNSQHWLPLWPEQSVSKVTVGFLSVLVTIPFWFVGFDTIPQAAEESSSNVSARTLARLIVMSVIAATAFYVVLILALSYAGPWQRTAAADLPAAKAIFFALNSTLMMNLVLIAALIGLFTSWNGFFLASSRVLFALGRGRIIPEMFGRMDPNKGTPIAAILVTGLLTVLAPLMGRQTLLSLVNAGSLFISIAFFGVSMSVMHLRRTAPEAERPFRLTVGNFVPWIAAVGSGLMVVAIIAPGSPVALSWPREILIVLTMITVGAVIWQLGAKNRNAIDETQRAYLILSKQGDSA